LKNGLASSSDTLPPATNNPLARLAELSAKHPDLGPYLTREMALRARRYMHGITLYRYHPIQRLPESMPVIWQSGSTLLRDYAPYASADAPVVLVVPSLINRFAILDLQDTHSFLRFLAAHGLRPLVVDWDTPLENEKSFSISDYVLKRLIPALHVASATRPVHIIGYCMGGLLALALASLCRDRTRSLTLLATPWDFHAGFAAAGQEGWLLNQKLQTWLRGEEPLPPDVMQTVFAALQPMNAFHKFSGFAVRDHTTPEADRFVLTEDWVNDGVPLTAAAARDCFDGWCAGNTMAKGEWKVGGLLIDPAKITAPSYVVVAGRDRIVPPESAVPLARALPHATMHEPMMGHIGIMSSSSAPHQVWTPLAHWLVAH
jgi:polyhydroxyalkanoate synthase